MARTLYCRLCAAPYDSVAGDQPAQCPTCEQDAHWSTEPQPTPLRREWELTFNDRRWMKDVGIGTE